MKEPARITCPHCGKETPAGDVCRYCGRETRSQQELEVHYTDFRGSEMLDIKMSPPGRHENEKPGPKREETAESGPLSEEKRGRGKTFLFFGAAVLITIAALAWYYVLKFFLKF